MSLTAAQIRVLSPVSYSGPVTVRGLVVPRSDGSAFAFDSLKTNGSSSIAAATFPGTIVTGGRLLDTVTVSAAAGASPGGAAVTVPATYPCAGCAYGAWVVNCCLDPLRFIPPVGVNGPILLNPVRVGSATLPMYTRASLVVSGATTGEPNEPGNDSAGGATPLVPRTYVFGALNGTTDTTDYYTFQLAAPAFVSLGTFNYAGTGVGDRSNPHLDAYVCDSVTGASCATETYLLNGPVRLPAGTVWLRIALRTPAAAFLAYRMYVGASP
jgi:hypothetical protein